MLTDDLLCKKLDKLNFTLLESDPSRSSEAGGLQCDQYRPVLCHSGTLILPS